MQSCVQRRVRDGGRGARARRGGGVRSPLLARHPREQSASKREEEGAGDDAGGAAAHAAIRQRHAARRSCREGLNRWRWRWRGRDCREGRQACCRQDQEKNNC